MSDEKFTGNTTPLVNNIGSGLHVHYFSDYTNSSTNLSGVYNPQRDAFGRFRVSNPQTIFESKFLNSGASAKQPSIWDESVTNATNGYSLHSASAAAITLHAEQGDTVIRQTFNRFHYQAGKSQAIEMTGVIGSGGASITSEIGAYNGTDGVFWESGSGVINLCIVKNGSINRIPQGSWNIDNFDGTGISGKTVDWDKNQIFVIEFEWLGVGGVGFGLFINRNLYYAHFENMANNSTDGAYMSTPNLPIRYSITNSGSVPAEIVQICSTVISEGGVTPVGQLRYSSLGTFAASEIQANTIGTRYAVCSIRLKSTHDSYTARPTFITINNTTNGDAEWKVHFNPTLSASLTYFDQYESAVQFGVAQGGQTITDEGVVIAGGYVSNDLAAQGQPIESNHSLGFYITGSSTEFVLSVNPIAINQDIFGGMGWREQ